MEVLEANLPWRDSLLENGAKAEENRSNRGRPNTDGLVGP